MKINYWEKLGNKPVDVVMRFGDEMLLGKRHFRGPEVHLSGNIFAWQSITQLFEDFNFLRALYEDARDALESGASFNSFSYNPCRDVGWSITDDSALYQPRDLIPFTFDLRYYPHAQRGTVGLMLKKYRWHLKAPLTKQITVTYELKEELDKFVIVILDLYPGRDYGEQSGNITRREKLIFFHWHHPGE
jgi:hypothetical protein